MTNRTDEMLKLWFEETVIPHLQWTEHKIQPTAEMFASSFRDYFSVRLRDVLPPHPISEKLRELEMTSLSEPPVVHLITDEDAEKGIHRRTVCCGKTYEELAMEVGESGFAAVNRNAEQLVTCDKYATSPEPMAYGVQEKSGEEMSRGYTVETEESLRAQGYEKCTPELLEKYPRICGLEPLIMRKFGEDGNHWHRTDDLVEGYEVQPHATFNRSVQAQKLPRGVNRTVNVCDQGYVGCDGTHENHGVENDT